MPYPSQVTPESIIQKAAEMVEQEGVEQLSLAKLASALGIKAPSLYRHVNNKDALLQAVNLQTLQRLFSEFDVILANVGDDAVERLTAVFHTYRTFAHNNPHCYRLALANPIDAQRPDEAILSQMVLPLQSLVAQITGEAHSLTVLRGLLALAHGFVMLELNNVLRRGGDLTAAYTQILTVTISGWQQN